MRVTIEILTGKLFYVEVDKEDATVLDLKREIESQENLPHDRLILILDDNVLIENETSLIAYGVRDGSHLYLFFCPLKLDEKSFTSANHFLSNLQD